MKRVLLSGLVMGLATFGCDDGGGDGQPPTADSGALDMQRTDSGTQATDMAPLDMAPDLGAPLDMAPALDMAPDMRMAMPIPDLGAPLDMAPALDMAPDMRMAMPIPDMGVAAPEPVAVASMVGDIDGSSLVRLQTSVDGVPVSTVRVRVGGGGPLLPDGPPLAPADTWVTFDLLPNDDDTPLTSAEQFLGQGNDWTAVLVRGAGGPRMVVLPLGTQRLDADTHRAFVMHALTDEAPGRLLSYADPAEPVVLTRFAGFGGTFGVHAPAAAPLNRVGFDADGDDRPEVDLVLGAQPGGEQSLVVLADTQWCTFRPPFEAAPDCRPYLWPLTGIVTRFFNTLSAGDVQLWASHRGVWPLMDLPRDTRSAPFRVRRNGYDLMVFEGVREPDEAPLIEQPYNPQGADTYVTVFVDAGAEGDAAAARTIAIRDPIPAAWRTHRLHAAGGTGSWWFVRPVGGDWVPMASVGNNPEGWLPVGPAGWHDFVAGTRVEVGVSEEADGAAPTTTFGPFNVQGDRSSIWVLKRRNGGLILVESSGEGPAITHAGVPALP